MTDILTKTERALLEGELVVGDKYRIKYQPSAGKRISSGEIKVRTIEVKLLSYYDSPTKGRCLDVLEDGETHRFISEDQISGIQKVIGPRRGKQTAKRKGAAG